MNNVVDEVLNKAATDNQIKYLITFEDGTTRLATIDLATPISIDGTPINKVLFDSIQTDLTSLSTNKLNTSAKAEQSEAEVGTINNKYMTPLRTQQKINSLQKKNTQISSTGTVVTSTIADYTSITDKIGTITGFSSGRSIATTSSSEFVDLIVNGTKINYTCFDETGARTTQTAQETSATFRYNPNGYFMLVVNPLLKVINGIIISDTMRRFEIHYTALTTIQISARGYNSSNPTVVNTTIQMSK